MAESVPRPLPVPVPAAAAVEPSALSALTVPAEPVTLANATRPASPAAQRRLAVGYVCVSDDEDLVNGLHGRLTAYAARAGLELVEVYVDRPSDAAESARPGLQLAVDEIARHPEALLLVPDLSHVPTARAGGETFAERFTTVVTEICALDARPAAALSLAVDVGAPAVAADAGLGPVAGAGRVRLTAEGRFEVTVEPDDDVAGVVATLRQVPAAARFVEALGDVEMTLVFVPIPLPTEGSGPHGDLVPFARVAPTGPSGPVSRELVGLTVDDLADRLHAALDGVPLGPQDEHVLAWLATQTADRALTISSLLRRARTRAA
ncbi:MULTISPECIES: hypothetical protein [Pseudofrankia]|uniref:hypothetical protein n=1 Tax=Pseudofrankia TaxID=2994363 RepID=UPI000234C7FD|nr:MULTISPECIES: hypothetical protein [Pseudofrankia]OHV27528.1 hypothetical protein BCD49_38805 [Pseudofrankia sp. EUN1h]